MQFDVKTETQKKVEVDDVLFDFARKNVEKYRYLRKLGCFENLDFF